MLLSSNLPCPVFTQVFAGCGFRDRRPLRRALVQRCGSVATVSFRMHLLTSLQAMASAGIIPGIITCIFSGSVAFLGLYLLSRCATRTPHRHASFFAVAQLTYPSAAVFFDLAIAIKCFGVSIRYVRRRFSPHADARKLLDHY